MQEDFNIKIGDTIQNNHFRPHTGCYGQRKRSDRSECLLQFCAGNDLVVANTLFQLYPRHEGNYLEIPF